MTRAPRAGVPSAGPLRLRAIVVLTALSSGVSPLPLGAVQGGSLEDAVSEEIRRRVERLRQHGELTVGGARTVTGLRLAELYEGRAFRSLWAPAAAAELRRFVGAVDGDGLDPEHYHAAALERSATDPRREAAAVAEADLLYSDALLEVAGDLSRGRVDPRMLDATWRVERPVPARLSPDSLAAIVREGSVVRFLDRLRPSHRIYRTMMRALADYRAVEEAGGWQRLPEGTLLKRDSTGPAVRLLRRRLAGEGDLPADVDTAAALFDEALAAGVRRFQHRHGLNPDGVVGPATLAELNVPARERIAQLRANLERARWVLRSLDDRFVAVNVAGQRVYAVQEDSVVLEMRAVVGRDYTRTPVFSALMRYLVLNPTWTVPRSINGEILANVRRDPDYLTRRGFDVLGPGGAPIELTGVEFERYTGGSFPYVFRQRPGPANALGRIKFMFPNEFNVYLHDTPDRALFGREERLFSHGCIRIEDPLGLAALLLDGWDEERLRRAMAAGETRTLELARPLPVLVLYWTAATDLHGEVHFYRDIYQRDAALLDALGRVRSPAPDGGE
jgi:murein L,D-transpeptidase YcbB/YkuD